jgi:dTDP-4-dehydrorhamnose reductase
VRISVIGAKGQLGSELVRAANLIHEVQELSSRDVDVRNPSNLLQVISQFAPDWIVNTEIGRAHV